MVTKDYSKSRMRENRTYGSVRGGQSNLIPSTRLETIYLYFYSFMYDFIPVFQQKFSLTYCWIWNKLQ